MSGFQRSSALDACRALAVLAVIVYHMSEFGIFPAPRAPFTLWPAFGMFGVDLFYVLSGFFITKAVLSPASWAPKAFWFARVTRIFPAYLISIVVVLCAKAWQGQVFDNHLLINTLLHVSMLHNFLGVGGTLNGVYWTLGVEFPYYLLMLSLAPFLREGRAFWYCSTAMLVIAILWRSGVFLFVPEGNRVFASTQLPGAIDAFSLGGIAAMINRNRYLTHVLTKWRWMLWVFSLICLAASLRYFSYHAGNYWSDGFSAIAWRSTFASSCALFILANAKMHHCSALNYTGLPWLGKISFSLYLYHLLPIIFVAQALPGQSWLVKASIASLLILTISWVSWRCIEVRFHRSATLPS